MKKTAAFWGWAANILIVAGVVIIFAAHLSPYSEDTRILLSLPAIVVTVTGLALYSPYWKRLDEAAQEAHKYAWFFLPGFSGGVRALKKE